MGCFIVTHSRGASLDFFYCVLISSRFRISDLFKGCIFSILYTYLIVRRHWCVFLRCQLKPEVFIRCIVRSINCFANFELGFCLRLFVCISYSQAVIFLIILHCCCQASVSVLLYLHGYGMRCCVICHSICASRFLCHLIGIGSFFRVFQASESCGFPCLNLDGLFSRHRCVCRAFLCLGQGELKLFIFVESFSPDSLLYQNLGTYILYLCI